MIKVIIIIIVLLVMIFVMSLCNIAKKAEEKDEMMYMMEKINSETITIEDCLELKNYKNQAVVINDGKIINIIQED